MNSSRCSGKAGDWQCTNPAVFAVWYEKHPFAARGACGKHLAQVTRDMLTDATQTTAPFVKVTGIH